MVREERDVESVVVSMLTGLLHVFGWSVLSWLICWLMDASEFARVVSNSRSVVAEEARLITGSQYSAGGWVLVVVLWLSWLLWKPAYLVVQSWS